MLQAENTKTNGSFSVPQLAVYFLMWLGWSLLWLPLLYTVAAATGLHSMFRQLAPTGSGELVNEAGMLFLIGVALISVTLIVWAKYNQFRFGARHRRQSSEIPSDQQVSEFFEIETSDLNSFKNQKVITLHFDNNVMRTELAPEMIAALKTETDSFMVADLQVSALLVQVRPGGEKRYFCRLSEYDWRPLASTDEMSLDEARDLVRQMMQQRYDGVADNIRKERDLTLEQFIDRHYRDAADSILHTEQFQADNSSLSKSDQDIESHAELFTFLMQLKMTVITKDDITAWQRAQLESGVERTEVIYRTEQLRSLFTRAVQWGVVSESPLNAIDTNQWLAAPAVISDVA